MAHRILLKLGAMKGELFHYSWRSLVRVMQALRLQEKVPTIFRANPHLRFAPREIEALEIDAQQTLIITLNFLGLQGASTPLPIHFSEAIIQDDPDDSGLNEFYNFFNQRIFMMLYAIEQKYAYLPQISQGLDDPMTQKLGHFAGLLGNDARDKKLLPYLPGMLGRNLEKNAWCRMLANVVGAETAWVKERVPTRLKIPSNCLTKLGSYSTLGQSISLGAYITQSKNHLELHLQIEHLADYLPHQVLFQTLRDLVRQTLRENLFVTVVLHARKAYAARLSRQAPMALGWSSLLGKNPIESCTVKLGLD